MFANWNHIWEWLFKCEWISEKYCERRIRKTQVQIVWVQRCATDSNLLCCAGQQTPSSAGGCQQALNNIILYIIKVRLKWTPKASLSPVLSLWVLSISSVKLQFNKSDMTEMFPIWLHVECSENMNKTFNCIPPLNKGQTLLSKANTFKDFIWSQETRNIQEISEFECSNVVRVWPSAAEGQYETGRLSRTSVPWFPGRLVPALWHGTEDEGSLNVQPVPFGLLVFIIGLVIFLITVVGCGMDGGRGRGRDWVRPGVAEALRLWSKAVCYWSTFLFLICSFLPSSLSFVLPFFLNFYF